MRSERYEYITTPSTSNKDTCIKNTNKKMYKHQQQKKMKKKRHVLPLYAPTPLLSLTRHLNRQEYSINMYM